METRRSEPSPVALYPHWVLLDKVKQCEESDGKTTAASLTSSGYFIRVSLRLAPPPALSRLCLESSVSQDEIKIFTRVLAAHGDSILLNVSASDRRFSENGGASLSRDYFVYNAGDAAGNPFVPPSLLLLPPLYSSVLHEEPEDEAVLVGDVVLPIEATALLRLGDEELVVAVLHLLYVPRGQPPEAILWVLRYGGWQTKWRLPVLHDEEKREELYYWYWDTDKVIPVGDGLLCWVDLYRGIIFSDVSVETPELRFVEVFRGCCSAGATDCTRSRHAFTITTWTLRMDGDMATWETDFVLGSDELWAFDGYHDGIPRVMPAYPVLTMDDDDPDAIVFKLEDETSSVTWLVETDTRKKTLRHATRHDGGFYNGHNVTPSEVSNYFNT
ncbi:hypothetical protein E2562_016528 [Oryza meyeriana var. granulata]|uniref:DUF1618 domain-containing protein n=1 Tax=Oryza meyeriana var. granulata TaxID=110450 RepID=A0A6G1C565_9ORYZ|nr:hypothetical protein E2562_016528 [Oryza meyeriana var. granulata]